MKKMAEKWDLERNIKYGHHVTGATWQEELGKWKIMVEHNGAVFEDHADIFISAQGFLK
jgi:cation diffusion facilitator CzcD-associated flavoprotein CzcO